MNNSKKYAAIARSQHPDRDAFTFSARPTGEIDCKYNEIWIIDMVAIDVDDAPQINTAAPYGRYGDPESATGWIAPRIERKESNYIPAGTRIRRTLGYCTECKRGGRLLDSDGTCYGCVEYFAEYGG